MNRQSLGLKQFLSVGPGQVLGRLAGNAMVAWVLLAAAFASRPVLAHTEELQGIQAVLSNTDSSPVPFGWTLGGVAYTGTALYQHGQSNTMFIPGGIYIGKDWMYLGDRLDYTLARQGAVSYFARARVRFGNLQPEDHPEWAGLQARKGQLEAGLGAVAVTDYGLWSARFSRDVSGRTGGSEVLLNWAAPLIFDRWLVLPSLGVLWRQDSLANYYFGGVTEAEAATGRPAYRVGHAWSFAPSLVVSYRLSPQWLLAGIAAADVFSSPIKNSPLVQRQARYDFLFALGYVWR